MGCAIIIFFIVVIIVMTQNVIVGAGIIICGGIICFLSIDKADKKHLSDIKNTQIFRIKDLIYIRNIVKEEMGTSGYFNMPVAIVGNVKRDKFQLYDQEDIWSDKLENSKVEYEQFYIEDDTGQIVIKKEVSSF